MTILLALAAVALGWALLSPVAARWAWALAALLVAASTLAGGTIAGLPVVVAVVAATVLEPAPAPPPRDFNILVGRLSALLIGVAGAVLLVIRVLQSDLTANFAVFLMALMAISAGVYMVLEGGRAEQSRAARLAVVLAAAAWAAGGHPGLAVPLTAALLLVLTSLAASRPVTA